jgi:hypothetical protein
MPTITHAIIGAALGMIFFTFTRDQQKKFKAEHLILIAINSFVGPDWPKFLSPFYGPGYWTSDTFTMINGFTHSVLGWCITAVAFSLIYYPIFRYLGEGKRTGRSPITFFHVYLLIVAGGICHFGLDILDQSIRVLPASFNTEIMWDLEYFSSGDRLAEGPLWDSMSWFDDKYLLIIGMVFLPLLIWLLKNKPIKYAWGLGIFFVVLIYGLIWAIGSNIVVNENDFGFFLYIMFAWITPLTICFYSMEEDYNKTDLNKNKKLEELEKN